MYDIKGHKPSSESTEKLFVGKSSAGQQAFGSNFKKYPQKVRASKIILTIFLLALIATFGYLGYRYYKEGPAFIMSIVGPQKKKISEEQNDTTQLSCIRDLDSNELISYGNASSGTEVIVLSFRKAKLIDISRDTTIKYSDASAGATSLEKVKEEHQKLLGTAASQERQALNAAYKHSHGTTTVHHHSNVGSLSTEIYDFFALPKDGGSYIKDYNELRFSYNRPSGKYSCTRTGVKIN